MWIHAHWVEAGLNLGYALVNCIQFVNCKQLTKALELKRPATLLSSSCSIAHQLFAKVLLNHKMKQAIPEVDINNKYQQLSSKEQPHNHTLFGSVLNISLPVSLPCKCPKWYWMPCATITIIYFPLLTILVTCTTAASRSHCQSCYLMCVCLCSHTCAWAHTHTALKCSYCTCGC